MDKLQKYNTALELRSQGQSYQKIADQVGMCKNTIFEWCQGKRDPSKLKNLLCKISDDEFIEIVKKNYSISQCLKAQGLKASGSNYKGFRERVKRLSLDTSHFSGQGHLKGKSHNWASEIPVEEAFINGGTLQSGNLKAKILKYNLKEYVCEECKITEWRGEKLSLHLDHINGINNDNRLENLRFLCPNCHSLTDTYCGKSKGAYRG